MNKKANRALSILLALVMIVGMLPISAFAENDPPATGTDIVVEELTNSTEEPTKETASPADPGELPGTGEGKEQDDNGGEDKTAESTPTPEPTPTATPEPTPTPTPEPSKAPAKQAAPALKGGVPALPGHGENNNDPGPATYPVTLVCDPTGGGSITIQRASPTSGNTERFAEGETVWLSIKANSGYAFKIPNGLIVNGETVTAREGGAVPGQYTASFTMPGQEAKVEATFESVGSDTYTVKVIGGRGSGSYAVGATVIIEATHPNFKEWRGADGLSFTSGSAGSRVAEFTMPARNVTLEAIYDGGTQEKYTVSVSADPSAGGTVTGGGTVTEGRSATVKATANSGYSFEGWYKGTTPVSTDNPYTFKPTGNVMLTAKFVPTHTVTLAADPVSIGADLEGGGSYPAGTEITVKTEKFINGIDGSFKFEGWYAGNTKVSDDVAYTFTVTVDTSLTAKFKKIVVFRYNISSDTVDLGEGIEIGDIRLENAGNRLPYEEHEKITLTRNGNPVGQWWNTTNPMIAIDPTELGVGTHTLTLNYPGSDEYCAASTDISVAVVKKLALSLDVFVPTYALLNTPYTISGRIVDENGDPYSGEVSLSVQNAEGAVQYTVLPYQTTDADGWFSCDVDVMLPASEGTRQIVVRVGGTDTYKDLKELPTIQFVNKLKTKLFVMTGPTVVDPSESAGFGFIITTEDDQPLPADTVKAAQLTLPPQATLALDAEYNVGMVEVPASALSAGANTLSLSWAGDESYEGCSATVTFTVANKQSLQLVEYAATLGKPGEPYTISGRFLDEDDQPLADTEITIRTQQEPGSTSMLPWFVTTDADGRFSYTVMQNLSYIHEGDTLDVELIVHATDAYLRFEKKDQLRFVTATISEIRVEGFEAPIAGKKAGDYLNLTVAPGCHYTIGTKRWFDNSQLRPLRADEEFVAGVDYVCQVLVETDTGYRFDDNVEFYANGSQDLVDTSHSFLIAGYDNTQGWLTLHAQTAVQQHTVSVTADPDEGGTVTGGGTVPVGGSVTVTARANEGYVFAGWYEGDTKVSDEASYTFTPAGDVTLRVKFKLLTRITDDRGNPLTGAQIDVNEYWLCDFQVRSKFGVMYGMQKDITVTSGSRVFELVDSMGIKGSELGLGEHDIVFSYAGDDDHAPCSVSVRLKVIEKKKAHVENFFPGAARVNATYTISGRVVDENGDPHGGQRINFSISATETSENYSGIGSTITDADGRFSCEISKHLPDEPCSRRIWIRVNATETHLQMWEIISVRFTDGAIHTVSFKDGDSELFTQSVERGRAVTPPADPKKDGHSFEGWYANESFSAAFDFTQPITADTVIYAKFGTICTVTVINGEADKTAAAAGETVTLTADEAPRGKTFDKWLVIAGNVSLADETASTTSFTMPSANVEVAATYKDLPPLTHTVTFVLNGGHWSDASTPDTVEVADGADVSYPSDWPEKDGYGFTGWYADSACTTHFNFYGNPITADTTVYAGWEKVWTVIFDLNGGSMGGSTETRPMEIPDGYESEIPSWDDLDGWLEAPANSEYTGAEITDATGTKTYQPGELYTLSSHATIKVLWKTTITPPLTYTVSFNANSGGGTMANVTVNAGEKLTLPECAFTPPSADKEFDKWDAGEPGEQVDITADCTITAIWKWKTPAPTETPAPAITYTVTGGADSTWTKDSGATVTITVKRSEADDTCFSHFTGVEIDGVALVKDTDYTAVAGSTVVTLKASALQTLSVGSHTVTVKFDDGKVSTGLTVKAASGTDTPTSPKTGDESNLALWLAMMIASLIAMVCVLLGIRKKKAQSGR